jgi:hypothetical protein
MTSQKTSPPSPAGPVTPPPSDGRERFTPRELDEVLGQYELGQITRVREVALGTPASPKAVVECARGTMLLKRRARGVDTPGLVAFSHELLLACLRAGVCVPPLIGTRGQNNSMVQLDDRIYELFVYIEGTVDPRSTPANLASGSLLAELHRAMDSVMESGGVGWPAPVEAAVIDPGRADRARIDPEIAGPVRGVLERAAAAGMGLDRRLVHGDWHPGNLVFRGDEPVAVCDFDNARSGSREREVAQGLVQFSLRRGAVGEPMARWPAEPDIDRLAAHWKGYREAGGDADLHTALRLMPGVLIEEALGAGDPETLWMALRKAQWLEDHQVEISARLGS